MLDRLYAVKRPIDYRKKSIDGKVWEKDKKRIIDQHLLSVLPNQ